MSASDTTSTGTAVNLPVAVLSHFNGDELSLILGSCLVDAVFLLDREAGNLVATNQRLLELIGCDLGEIEDSELAFSRFIHPEDRGVFRLWSKEGVFGDHGVFETRLLDGHGGALAVEVATKIIRWQGKEYYLGFVRPCSERVAREKHLKRQLEDQKDRAKRALKSSLRVYELNEKIKSTLELTTALLNIEGEDQLYAESVKILSNPEGLNFKAVRFLVKDGMGLRVVGNEKERYALNGDNKYSRFIRAGLARTEDAALREGQEVLVPLQSRDSLLGLIEVTQHAHEWDFIKEYRLLVDWQRDMLFQIGDIIALLLDNLRLKRELKRQSIVDPLTGAYNRNFFMARLESEVRRAFRYGRPVSVVFIDVDLFKEVNDHYGHLQGDRVLSELGKVFSDTLRATDVLCRYGGDEFVIVLPETGIEESAEAVSKIRQVVSEHQFENVDVPDQFISVSISLGAATLKDGQTVEKLLQAADAELYRDKGDIAERKRRCRFI